MKSAVSLFYAGTFGKKDGLLYCSMHSIDWQGDTRMFIWFSLAGVTKISMRNFLPHGEVTI